MCWVKHNEKGSWGVVTLTFPIAFTTVLWCATGAEGASGDYTTTNAMSGRGASRSHYRDLTTTSIGVQGYQDVYVVIFGI